MEIVKVNSACLHNGEAHRVIVEVSVEPGIGIHIVGLADAASKEMLLRVVTAI